MRFIWQALLSERPEGSLRELHRQRPLPCIGGGVESLGPTDHRFELGERKSSAYSGRKIRNAVRATERRQCNSQYSVGSEGASCESARRNRRHDVQPNKTNHEPHRQPDEDRSK